MFKQNKYSQIYYSIIERAKSRSIVGYTESHHIIPRSMGGTDDRINLVELTAREHYICHLLLPKMTDGEHHYKMIYAYTIMSGRKIYGARKYAFYREEYAKINSELRSGEGNGMWGADRSGEKNTFYGKKHSEETKRKISEKKTGQGKGIKKPPFTKEHRSNISKRMVEQAKKYMFNHHEHGTFIGSTGELGRAFNFRGSEAYKLVKGEYKSYKGWKLA